MTFEEKNSFQWDSWKFVFNITILFYVKRKKKMTFKEAKTEMSYFYLSFDSCGREIEYSHI